MTPVADSDDEPEDRSGPRKGQDVEVRIPEEFTGWILSELQACGGYVKDMDSQESTITSQAALPASQYDAMARPIRQVGGSSSLRR